MKRFILFLLLFCSTASAETVSNQLIQLNQTKIDIGAAIASKGQDVTGLPFTRYGEAISSITTGISEASVTDFIVLPQANRDSCPSWSCTITASPQTMSGANTALTAVNGLFSGAVMMPNKKVCLLPSYYDNIGIWDPIANVYTNGPLADSTDNTFFGGVLGNNGNVYLIPYMNSSPYIGIYYPSTNLFKKGVSLPTSSGAFAGGVLMPDGRICLVPRTSDYVGIYDPTTASGTYTQGCLATTTEYAFSRGCLLPDGRVFLCPRYSRKIAIFNPTDTASGSIFWGPTTANFDGAYNGCVLMPDGRVLMVPSEHDEIGLYDPDTNSFNTVDMATTTKDAFDGAVVMADGNILLIPHDSNNFGIFYPDTDSFSLGISKSYTGYSPPTSAYVGGVLTTSGAVGLVPFYADYIGVYSNGSGGVSLETCLHPAINKL